MSILMVWWWLFPAAVANVLPVLLKRLNFLDYPIDGGMFLFGQRLFGAHKTYRGLIFGIVGGAACAAIQSVFIANIYLDNAWAWGVLLGLGALLGDLIKSFFKRRLEVGDGQPLWVADQIDWIIGALIMTQYIAQWQTVEVAFVIVTGATAHLIVNVTGYYLGLNKKMY